jgi:hypothetical protein
MNRRAVIVGGCLAAAYVWSALASAIYCLGTGNPGLLTLPFLQWWQVLPYWDANWWVTLWFVLAAFIPLLPVAIAGRMMVMRRGLRDASSDLYGQTRWPARDDIQRGGFSLRKKL